jgi:hypothetical protein
MHHIESLSFAIFFAPVNSLACTEFTLTRRDSEAAVAKLIDAIPGCFVSGTNLWKLEIHSLFDSGCCLFAEIWKS